MERKTVVRQVAVTFAALGLSWMAPLAAGAQVEVTVNGSAVEIAPPPITQAGRVFVPLRGVFEQLGASVVYANGTINATGNGRDISLQIGSTQATVNGQQQSIDVAPFIVGESTFVPLRFITEALGDSVRWDEANSIAAIGTAGGSSDYYQPGTASYVDTAPPQLPDYDQPEVSEPNAIWQPGYWGWGSFGYYWVPGTWVQAPQVGYFWTPGYWQWNTAGYNWNPGYWASAVGFYGGVNYGGGYGGRGYDGGRWSRNVFRYNTFVTRVNVRTIRNVYVDRNVYVRTSTVHMSYNGGPAGLRTRPTPQQIAVAKGRHLGMTKAQRQHLAVAEQDRRLLAGANRSKPAVLAVSRPLSKQNRPAGFVPVRPSDRVNPQAHVAPVHVSPIRAVRPAPHAPLTSTHAAAPRGGPAAHPRPVAPVIHAPATAIVPIAHAPKIHAVAAPAPSVKAPRPVKPAPPTRHVPAVYAAPAHVPAVHPAPAVPHPLSANRARPAPPHQQAGAPAAPRPKRSETAPMIAHPRCVGAVDLLHFSIRAVLI